jgi:hypothetical protein
MDMYFSPSKNEFFLHDLKTSYVKGGGWPADCKKINEDVWREYSLNKEGFVRVVNSEGEPSWDGDSTYKAGVERGWRNSELSRSDVELNKVQDSDPKAKGSVADWRVYRKALRAWPEHKDFPNKEFRPVPPDV